MRHEMQHRLDLPHLSDDHVQQLVEERLHPISMSYVELLTHVAFLPQ
jgi:hypothetical protein